MFVPSSIDFLGLEILHFEVRAVWNVILSIIIFVQRFELISSS